jgi:nitrilase
MVKIAVMQHAPVLFNRDKTIAKAQQLIAQAAKEQAQLIIFPEAFISGYPAWTWRLRPGGDWETSKQLHQALLNSAVDIDAGQLKPLQETAKLHHVTVVCGLNERDGKLGRTTVYNSVVIIGNNGELLNHHRKLMPTNPERMVWGFGDGSGLNVVDTPIGRLGTLICWENYMPLARYSLYAQGVEIYIAPTYDSGEGWIGSMQHIAREGRCWVVNSGVAWHYSDLPEDFPDKNQLYPDAEEWINDGDSLVVAPGGKIIAGPKHQEHGILFAEIDLQEVASARRDLDVAGHYSRPDIFTLHINKQPQSPIKITDS